MTAATSKREGTIMSKTTRNVAAVTMLLVAATVTGLRASRSRRHKAAGAAAPAGAVALQPETPAQTRRREANRRSVLEASSSGKHPERLSPLMPPTPFDRTAFEADPDAYLDVVEPGRCFQTATADGPDAVALVGSPLVAATPGAMVPLLVRGAPGAPVTFTAFDGGVFAENGLGSVSVRADARGYAVVNFATPPDARGHLAVVAGSPLAVGNQRFFVEITPPLAANDG
jgi:hypothetical protein